MTREPRFRARVVFLAVCMAVALPWGVGVITLVRRVG